jgi:FkbM family methyltransferase
MKIRGLRRYFERRLAGTPQFYKSLLMATGRGSLEKRLFLGLIRRGNVVFDVGANVGNFTILFADLVGTSGSVHAFEPIPPTFSLLCERARRENHHENILTNPVACSDGTGVIEIKVPDGDFGQASMRSHAAGSWLTAKSVQGFLVPTLKLGDYMAENHLTQVDLIKCDCEGAELFVLKGAVNLLRRFEPVLFLEVAEFWTKDFGYRSSDLVDFLVDSGYSHFLIEDEPVRQEEIRERLADKAREGSVNIVCACKADALRHVVALPESHLASSSEART